MLHSKGNLHKQFATQAKLTIINHTSNFTKHPHSNGNIQKESNTKARKITNASALHRPFANKSHSNTNCTNNSHSIYFLNQFHEHNHTRNAKFKNNSQPKPNPQQSNKPQTSQTIHIQTAEFKTNRTQKHHIHKHKRITSPIRKQITFEHKLQKQKAQLHQQRVYPIRIPLKTTFGTRNPQRSHIHNPTSTK